MSAFQVSPAHISAIVTFGVAAGLVSDIKAAGTMLTQANHASIVARYNDLGAAPAFRFVAAPVLSAVQIVKLCNCFDYQACEVADYDATPAAALVEAIRNAAVAATGCTADAIGKTDLYRNTPWSI